MSARTADFASRAIRRAWRARRGGDRETLIGRVQRVRNSVIYINSRPTLLSKSVGPSNYGLREQVDQLQTWTRRYTHPYPSQ